MNPYDRPNKSDFERHLNDQPFPAIKVDGKPVKSKKYGTWLRDNNNAKFMREFEAWKKTQSPSKYVPALAGVVKISPDESFYRPIRHDGSSSRKRFNTVDEARAWSRDTGTILAGIEHVTISGGRSQLRTVVVNRVA